MKLDTLISALKANGCSRVFAKTLADNDNSKNQIYFGPGFEALNIFPNLKIYADGRIFKTGINFSWLDDRLNLYPAPDSKIIFYPQYPEVRFSGFLKGCKKAPSELMTKRAAGRVLFLGVTVDGRVIGYAAPKNSPLANEFDALRIAPEITVFKEITNIQRTDQIDTQRELLRKLKDIHSKGWIDSKKFNEEGQIVECRASNCGGYTLETEFGIRPNGFSEPDFLGWEIKQHGVRNFSQINTGIITLFTPEPNSGYYKEKGVFKFVSKYGYPDKTGKKGRENRWNFGGVHKAGEKHHLTSLILTLTGYDRTTGKIIDSNGGIDLLDSKGDCAARWTYAGLMLHWQRKHSLAVYVPSITQADPLQYSYGNVVRLGKGTDFLKFLKAVSETKIYYDPGIKIENFKSDHPLTKRRSQFRIKSGDIPVLYNRMETIDVSTL